MNLLIVHPGANESTCDVEAGLCFGLQHHGCRVWRYRLDMMIDPARRWLFSKWRVNKKHLPSAVKPTSDDVYYQAGLGALELALRHEVDSVIVVSAMFFHPLVLTMMRRAGLKVFVIFTESPYDMDRELAIAAHADGCWTNERTCVSAFLKVQPNSGYLAHGWHPERHHPGLQPGDEQAPAHDVIFVGTAFKERIALLDAIDWSGIDLGLYGNWQTTLLPSKHRLRQYVKGAQINNRTTAALYRRAKVGLNLYRDTPAGLPLAESLNPRAYELAACGVCMVSTERAEGRDVFGSFVPAPTELIIRDLLREPERRAALQRVLPETVAQASWVERAKVVLGDLQFFQRAAA